MENEDAGLEVLRKIRESGSNVPFYLVSATSQRVFRTAIEYGVTGVYDKSNFNADELVKDMVQHLK